MIESEKLYKGIVEDLQKVKAVVPVEVSESIQKSSKALKGLVARAEKGSIIQGASQVRGAMAGTAASTATS